MPQKPMCYVVTTKAPGVDRIFRDNLDCARFEAYQLHEELGGLYEVEIELADGYDAMTLEILEAKRVES